MMLRHLVFILLVTNVPGESTSALQKASFASENSQSFGLSDAVVNTQIFTMFRYKGRQVYVYSALSNDHGNADSPRKWIFYYVPVVIAELRKDLNGNLSTAWIVENDVRVNILLGNPEIDELARKAVKKKHNPDVGEFAEYWDVAPLMIDSLTAYIVKESSNPVEGVHPFSMVHPNDFIINARFSCSSREKGEIVVNNILDGIYQVEIAFFFGGFRQVSTNSVSITGRQLKNVFSKAVADGGSTKALYIHRSQSSKFVDTCIMNLNIVVYIEEKSRNPQDQHNDLEKQLFSLLQQGMVSAEQTIIDAKHWDQIWSPADLNPDKIAREMNNNFIYNEDETKKHNSSDIYFDRKTGLSSSSTDKDSWDFGPKVSGWGVTGGIKIGKSNDTSRSNSQEQAQAGKQISSLTEINHDLNKRHLQLEWTGEKLIPKSFSVVRLTDLEDSLQVHLSKKNLMAEKERGAILHTLKGLHKSDNEGFMFSNWQKYLASVLCIVAPVCGWWFCCISGTRRGTASTSLRQSSISELSRSRMENAFVPETDIELVFANGLCKIETESESGSGFLCAFKCGANNYVRGMFTTNHILDRMEVFSMTKGSSKIHIRVDQIQYFWTNKDIDVTFITFTREFALSLNENGWYFFAVADEKTAVLSPVTILQHPEGERASVSRGEVIYCSKDTLLYTASTLPGSSGSPLIETDYRVFGIHKGGLPRRNKNDKNQGVLYNIGTPIKHVIDLVSEMPDAVSNSISLEGPT